MTRDDAKFWIPILLVMIVGDLVLVIKWEMLGLGIALIVFLLLFLWTSYGIKIVPEYERRVIYRLGKCIGSKGPGLIWANPLLDRVVTVDVRERFHEVSHEACITKDNAKIDVDFLFYWKVVNPEWSQTRVQNLEASLEGLATGLLRAVIGLFLLDEALAQRERINEELKDELEDVSEHWGVMVTTVEIREIVPPKDIQDAMHRQLAAERDRRAVILEAQGQRENAVLRAEGESLALERLYRAAKEIDAKTLQLKYLEALAELGKSSSTKYIFPLEFTQLVKPFVQNDPVAGAAQSTPPAPNLGTGDLIGLLKSLTDAAKTFGGKPVDGAPTRDAGVMPSSSIARIIGQSEKDTT